MGRINSRRKGARGELELAHWLTEHGFDARRGQQFSGSPDSPDVVCERLAGLGFQIECKRVEQFSLYKALEQARADAGPFMDGIVFHRRNGCPWVVVMDAESFVRLAQRAEGGRDDR